MDAFGPVVINGHLSLSRPATERWNLGRDTRSAIQAWSKVPWDDLGLDADEDPRKLFGRDELSFGTCDGLWPIASTDRGEAVFPIASANSPRRLVTYHETWAEYRMSFAEWLYRYLIGEDMSGPNSAVFYPGPVQLRHLPMTPDERPDPGTPRTAASEPRRRQPAHPAGPTCRVVRELPRNCP
ncbi:SMI1/KNR4 family protein [Streptomyces antibioticus]|uniref:SMI1/KNR4 family protein n=1 Tax=Streptomyces antibioticus TaxID=1890 RepID=UPI002252D1E1|nr:SMI1/KNR4 family protein [Streptomyces antibioticus]MCX5173438.1 SMI1/KNR4 family protein [Streptomyces antibioticus]